MIHPLGNMTDMVFHLAIVVAYALVGIEMNVGVQIVDEW